MPSVRRVLFVFAAAAAAALAIAPPAAAGRTIRLKVPRFVVPPRSDLEVCTFVRLPMRKTFNLGGSVIANVGINSTFTSHHFLIWAYEGTDLNAFPPKGQLVPSKACLDFGPTDTNRRTLIGGSQQPFLKVRLPDGLAQQIKPTVSGGQQAVGIILNSHWINGANKPQRAAVKIKLIAAKPNTVRRFVLPIFEVTANAYIGAPPGQEHTEHGYWGPGSLNLNSSLGGGSVPDKNATACVVGVTSHMHKRGVMFTIDLVQGPVDIFAFGPETEQVLTPNILRTTEYTDPPQVSLMNNGGGMPLHPNEYLRYTCTHDNTGKDPTRPMKMGCEEKPGVTPGESIFQLILEGKFDLNSGSTTTGAARRCSSDTDCAGFGTGKCVPANLVFGFTSDDDMCIMPGGYYDADASGNCDVMTFPIEPNG